jgi:hypothetical protein
VRQGTGQGYPDFVICGTPNPNGGVRLIASRELNYAELSMESSYARIDDWLVSIPLMTSYRVRLTTDMRTCVLIDAPDYATAFEHLFRDWSPDSRTPVEPAARALEPGTRELDP